MTDYFLKFAHRAEAVNALTESGFSIGDGDTSVAGHGFAIDMIGSLSQPTGQFSAGENGFDYPVFSVLPGYHVNIRLSGLDLPSSLGPFCIFPTTPMRIFG